MELFLQYTLMIAQTDKVIKEIIDIMVSSGGQIAFLGLFFFFNPDVHRLNRNYSCTPEMAAC